MIELGGFKMSVCTNITQVPNTNYGEDLLQVTIDNDITAFWFYNYADSLKYLNQEVIVDYRQEILNGNKVQFINTFCLPVKVTTLDKTSGIKLFIDQEDNQSNVSFNAIEVGRTEYGCIVYCSAQEFKSSANAVWMELIIRDRLMRTAKMRIFDYEDKKIVLAGRYIRADLSKSKYGFQTQMAVALDLEVNPNAEIEIATEFIRNYFADDTEALNYINKVRLIESLNDVVDYEKGYALVRLATELSFVDAMKNVSKDVDLRTLGRVILTSYGFHTRTSSLSPSINNVILVTQFHFEDKTAIAQCLDVGLTEHSSVYNVWKRIQELTSTLLEVRKGVDL